MTQNGATGVCVGCGCALQPDALGRHMRRRCAACKKVFEKERLRVAKHRALADPVKREAIREYERRRVSRKRGRPVRSREQIASDRERRKKERQQRRTPRDKDARLVESLKLNMPHLYDTMLSKNALRYRARYHCDDEFRAKEIRRLHLKKDKRLVADGTLTGAVMRSLFGGARRCLYCDEPMRSEDKTLDHIIPRSMGGWHAKSNVVVCCKSCNARKRDKTPEQWITCVDAALQGRVRRAWRAAGYTGERWLST